MRRPHNDNRSAYSTAHYDCDSSDNSTGSLERRDYHKARRSSSTAGPSYHHSYKKPEMPDRKLYLALDCEMVEVQAPDGSCSSECARVVLIDWKGRTVLDKFVKPLHPVVDYRTFVSGICQEDLTDATCFSIVQKRVSELIQGRILVGHGLENDLSALKLHHDWWMIRDTAYYRPFMRDCGGNIFVPNKLRDLCHDKLHREIQSADHCPKEDAKAALDLYKSHRPRWESCMLTLWQKIQHEQQQMLLSYAA